MSSEPGVMLFEMTERPLLNASRPHRGGMLLRLEEPAIDFYRFLLRSIDLDADDIRLQLGDAELFELLQNPLIEVFVLFSGGAPAGLFELDRRVDDEVQLARFGLLPGFGGRGLAKYLLATAIDTAWDEEPNRVWVSVRDDSDPRSLLLYQWAGFSPYAIDSG